MMDGGDSINLAELSNLGFAKSMAVLPNGDAVLDKEEDLSTAMFDEEDLPDQDHTIDPEEHDSAHAEIVDPVAEDIEPAEEKLFDRDPADMLEEDIHSESELDIPPEPSPKRLATSPARRGVNLARPYAPLCETDGNARSQATEKTQPPSVDSADSGIGSLNSSIDSPLEEHLPNESPVRRRSKIPQVSWDYMSRSRSSLLTQTQVRKESAQPMSIQEKLAAVETEARETQAKQEVQDKEQQQDRPQKRKASRSLIGRKANRRRSTLAPDELAQLMSVR